MLGISGWNEDNIKLTILINDIKSMWLNDGRGKEGKLSNSGGSVLDQAV